MKKILSYLLLITFFIVNNFTFVFAENSNDTLNSDKNTAILLLDKVEDKLQTSLDKVESKIVDEEIKEKISEKQQEIEAYIEIKQKEIQNENSKSDIKEIIEETAKVVTLKAVAGVTSTSDISENLSNQLDLSKNDLLKAEKSLISSMETEEGVNIMLKSKLTLNEVIFILKKFDEKLQIEELFFEDNNYYYDLTITSDSLLKKELLEDVETGEIPNNLLGIEVIKPELLKIGDIDFSGEEVDKIWGMNMYGVNKYLSFIEQKSTENGKKVKVGVIDTGISYNHPDLKNNISKSVDGYDFVNEDSDPLDDQGHGTHVSGTIAASLNNTGVYGVNPNVELVGLKICDSSGFCPTYGVFKAINYAVEHKIDVLNMSLGAKGNIDTSPICQAIKDATNAGVIVVAAAGNSNIDTSKFVPGGCREAITVGAVDETLTRASFSNYGDKVDVSAPGVAIYSTYLNNGYKSLNGTSMATPHIVGLVSVIKTFKPSITSSEVKELFKTYSIKVNTEANKKIASFVDYQKIMTSLGFNIPNESKVELSNKIIDNNLEQSIVNPINNQANINNSTDIQNNVLSGVIDNLEKNPSELGLVDISNIDESIGLIIQNNEEEQTRINSAGEEEFKSEGIGEIDGIKGDKQILNLNKSEDNSSGNQDYVM